MADEQQYTVSGLEVRHVPDSSLEQGPDGNKQRVALPGKYHLGAVVEGAFVELAVIGHNRLQKKIDQAKQQQQADQQASEQQPPQA